MNHPVETFGVRVEHGGTVIAYSADTAPCESLLRLAQDSTLFLCEAQLPRRAGESPRIAPHRAGSRRTRDQSRGRAAVAYPSGAGVVRRDENPRGG